MRAAFDGRIDIEDAERLKKLLLDRTDNRISLSIATTDPVEASRLYQQIMTA